MLRIIARLNVGGPAIQAITLTKELKRHGYDTTLLRGREGEREGSMDSLAEALDVHPVLVPSLGRAIRPLADLKALMAIRRTIRRERPSIIHTHTAKAGALGRIAALTTHPRPRLIVHTFHGHVLSGYFTSRSERFFAYLERLLARRTDVLVAVSEEVREELLQLGIGEEQQLRVVPLGFDLERFSMSDEDSGAARSRVRDGLGVDRDAPLVTIVARLVPIKRIDLFLRAGLRVVQEVPNARFCIAGDGELADQLKTSSAGRELGDRAVWTGFRDDTPSIYAASDVVALSSDNEGTPVSLIEALASGRGVVGTRVGGVPSVVTDGETGLLVPPNDPVGLAAAITSLIRDPDRCRRMGDRGRTDVVARFSLERLVTDIVGLYRDSAVPRR